MGSFMVIMSKSIPQQKMSNLETGPKKLEKLKNCPLIKNLQFLSYYYGTWSKGPSHWVVILTKFHDDSSKIVGFLLVDIF